MAEFFAALAGFFKFFDQVSYFIKILQKTPEEQHEALLAKIAIEAKKFEETGRPDWN